MSEIFDERRRGLEEEYMHRKDQEGLEKLRAQLAAETRAKEREAGIMHCPRCDTPLTATTYEGLKVDHCDKCKGWWLDAGELEQLTKHNEGGIIQRFLHSLSAE